MSPTDHPAPTELAAFHAGDLPPADIDRVAAHLEGCAARQAQLQALDGHTGLVADAIRDPRPAAPAAALKYSRPELSSVTVHLQGPAGPLQQVV